MEKSELALFYLGADEWHMPARQPALAWAWPLLPLVSLSFQELCTLIALLFKA